MPTKRHPNSIPDSAYHKADIKDSWSKLHKILKDHGVLEKELFYWTEIRPRTFQYWRKNGTMPRLLQIIIEYDVLLRWAEEQKPMGRMDPRRRQTAMNVERNRPG